MIPSLRTSVLGSVSFQLNDKPLAGLTAVKAQALLIYLAVTGRPHTRVSLAGLLWSDVLESAAHNSLRVTLAQLRQAVGDYIDATRQTISLASERSIWLDVTEFVQACSILQSAAADIEESKYQTLRRGVHLYRGEFVSGFYVPYAELFEEWVVAERAYYSRLALEGLTRLGTLALQRSAPAAGIEDMQRVLTLDPLLEEAHQLLMQLYAANRQTTLALRQYDVCARVLEQELGIAPAAETVALVEAIRARTLEVPEPPPSPVQILPPQRDSEVARRPHHNLPLQPTPFIGRQQELAALAELIADPQCRLITLLGPGGTGKTRLALQAASDERATFADGIIFVSLASLDAAELIVPTVAAALNFTLANHAAPNTELLHYLRHKELLLVLDNFEHLLTPLTPSSVGNDNDSATELLTAIIQQAPSVTMLVTSRARLNIRGEWTFDVGGLETPAEAYSISEERNTEFEAYSAVALFLQTARRLQKGFMPTAADRAAIVQICQLVQGMPLALELAAAWVRVLSCPEIAHEIAQSLGFLTTTLRDLPARHRSLQAVFDHSWQMLTSDEQRVFAGCSVFRGGFTRQAASAVAGASLSTLAALVDKALLRRNLDGRYAVHELARQYAAARLTDAQQIVQARHRHLEFFMHFAEGAQSQIHIGQQAAKWHEWVEIDHDNLRAALDWSLSSGELEPGLRIVAALMEFWMNRGYAPEGQSQAERFLARAETAAYPYLRGMALHSAGACAFYHGRYQVSRMWLEEAVAIGRELGASGKDVLAMALIALEYTLSHFQEFDTLQLQALSEEALLLSNGLKVGWVKSHALNQLAGHAWRRGDYIGAHQRFLESLECFEADGNNYERALVIWRLGIMHYEQGDYVAANVYFRQGLSIFEEVGDKVRISGTLTWLGRLAMTQGNDSEAEELLTKALWLIRQTGHLLHRIDPLDVLGRLAQRQGDYARARIYHQESLALSIEMEHAERLARTLEGIACLAARQGQADVATRLFSFAVVETQFDPTWQLEHDDLIANVRTQLGEANFTAAWAAGAAMTLDEAVALAEA